jgi:hypothetical protein
MKTMTTIFLTAILMLQVNSIFASSDGVAQGPNKEINLSTYLLSAPVTPKEATFEEFSPAAEIILLAPVTPKEASFDDEAEIFISAGLAPLTPAEADFTDTEPISNVPVISLFPVTPSEADFTDLP